MALTRISGIGTTGDPTTFSADQIIGKVLVAATNVPIYNDPNDNATPIYYIASGQNVGTVYSWLDADPPDGRTGLWWMFQNSNGYYYVPHKQGYFNIQALVDQGALTVAQATALQNAAAPTIMTYIDKYLPWILIAVAAIAFGKQFISSELQRNI